MKKLVFILSAFFLLNISLKCQNLGALLAPIPGLDINEYIVVKYQMDQESEKIQNVFISNGNINEKLNREFKSLVELYNFLGRSGWAYISKENKEEKGVVLYSVYFTRKIIMRSGMINQPVNKNDSMRRQRPTQNPQVAPQPQEAPPMKPKFEGKKK